MRLQTPVGNVQRRRGAIEQLYKSLQRISLPSDHRSLGSSSTCNIQWDMESNTERAINASRKNLTDGNCEAGEDPRSGEPPPEPPPLETFADSLQLVTTVGETHNVMVFGALGRFPRPGIFVGSRRCWRGHGAGCACCHAGGA